jgi:hypothetical protein
MIPVEILGILTETVCVDDAIIREHYCRPHHDSEFDITWHFMFQSVLIAPASGISSVCFST